MLYFSFILGNFEYHCALPPSFSLLCHVKLILGKSCQGCQQKRAVDILNILNVDRKLVTLCTVLIYSVSSSNFSVQYIVLLYLSFKSVPLVLIMCLTSVITLSKSFSVLLIACLETWCLIPVSVLFQLPAPRHWSF